MRNLLRIILIGFATALFGQTSTVTVNTTTKVTQPPIGILTMDGAVGFKLTRSTGTPNGVISASPGSLCLDQDGALWLKTTGTGNTGWTQPTGGGGTPGGSPGSIQYNNAGAFGGFSGDTGLANNFLTGISSAGVTKARPSITNLTDLSGTSKLIGSKDSSATVTEITLGTNLSMTGATLNAAGGGGGTPGGSDTQVQFNDGGSFGGIATAIYTKATGALSLGSGGTNQNITLSPSGNAWVSVNANAESAASAGGTLNLGWNYSNALGESCFLNGYDAGGLAPQFTFLAKDGSALASIWGGRSLYGVGGGVKSPSTGFFGWTASDAYAAFDTALSRNAAGVVEVNNGTAGQYRDLIVRDINPGTGSGLQVLRRNAGNTALEYATLAGGGNVSNTGTPTIGQYARWTNATTIEGVATSTVKSDLSLGNVTNDAQTKASVMPNTAPSSGQIPVGNAGGTAYVPQTLSGSGVTATLSSAGVLTLSAIPNATLSNSSITIAGTSTALGGSISRDTITGLSSTGLVTRTAANTLGTITDNSANWDTAFTDRLKWDGGSTGLTASTGRTSLGATTIGSNLFTLANPSAITFMRINADNSITMQDAFNFLVSLGSTQFGRAVFSAGNPASDELVVHQAVGSLSGMTAPTGAVVGTTDTQTLSNKRITQRVVAQASGATWSPNGDTTDIFTITTAQATNVTTISAPTGTPNDGQGLIFRIKCDATPRTLAGWDAIYRFSTNMAAPTTLTASKTFYMGFRYNSTDLKWDNVAQMDGY